MLVRTAPLHPLPVVSPLLEKRRVLPHDRLHLIRTIEAVHEAEVIARLIMSTNKVSDVASGRCWNTTGTAMAAYTLRAAASLIVTLSVPLSCPVYSGMVLPASDLPSQAS